jgi:hypothetical protein
MANNPALRVLFFAHETTWSGAPIQLLHLVTWLKRAGWEVAVAVPRASAVMNGDRSDEDLIVASLVQFASQQQADPPGFAPQSAATATIGMFCWAKLSGPKEFEAMLKSSTPESMGFTRSDYDKIVAIK